MSQLSRISFGSTGEIAGVPPQRFAEEENQGIERLLLCGQGHAPLNRQLAQEPLEVLTGRRFEFARADKRREPPGPLAIGLLRAPGVVLEPEPLD